MAVWRKVLVVGHLAACSALVLKDHDQDSPSGPENVSSEPELENASSSPSEQGARLRKPEIVSSAPQQSWGRSGSDVAVFLPIPHCERGGFWADMGRCIHHVAEGARKLGKTVSVHVGAGRACAANMTAEGQSPFRGLHDDVKVYTFTKDVNSSGRLLAYLLQEAALAKAEHDLVLVMGSDAGVNQVEVRHRAVQSLCGSANQVISVLRQFRRDDQMQLIAPLGTMMTSKTKTVDIMPRLRTTRFKDAGNCSRMFNQSRLQRLGQNAPNQAGAVAVAGGMYWAKYSAIPDHTFRELSASLDGKQDAQRTLTEVWIPSQMQSQGGVLAEIPPAPKPLAMYFPQYHPIPENDRFWGTNFTEWTLLRPFNASQIRKPLNETKGGLGYYDLRDKKVREKQGKLAKDHGIHGFVYYHYWFSSVKGHKVMYKVPELRIADGEPDMPFMLSWANEAWSRHWDGNSTRNTAMLEQDYGEADEWKDHFNYLLQFFKHPKYIRVEGKPAFAIYRPGLMHDKLEKMLTLWHKMAAEAGLPGLHIIATVGTFYRDPDERKWQSTPTVNAAFHFLASDRCCWAEGKEPPAPPDKQAASTNSDSDQVVQPVQYWGAFVGFDNRPRLQEGQIYPRIKLTPSDFGIAVGYSLEGMAQSPRRDVSENLYFLGSWNEWNEQSVLEPDDTYKTGFLEALSNQLRKVPVRVFVPPP